jgi:hypothetical protein
VSALARRSREGVYLKHTSLLRPKGLLRGWCAVGFREPEPGTSNALGLPAQRSRSCLLVDGGSARVKGRFTSDCRPSHRRRAPPQRLHDLGSTHG